MASRLTGGSPELIDALGPIPMFPPPPLDASGKPIPLSPEDREARRQAALRILDAIAEIPDDDPPDLMEEGMRAIDEARPPGQKLFEGMY